MKQSSSREYRGNQRMNVLLYNRLCAPEWDICILLLAIDFLWKVHLLPSAIQTECRSRQEGFIKTAIRIRLTVCCSCSVCQTSTFTFAFYLRELTMATSLHDSKLSEFDLRVFTLPKIAIHSPFQSKSPCDASAEWRSIAWRHAAIRGWISPWTLIPRMYRHPMPHCHQN